MADSDAGCLLPPVLVIFHACDYKKLPHLDRHQHPPHFLSSLLVRLKVESLDNPNDVGPPTDKPTPLAVHLSRLRQLTIKFRLRNGLQLLGSRLDGNERYPHGDKLLLSRTRLLQIEQTLMGHLPTKIARFLRKQKKNRLSLTIKNKHNDNNGQLHRWIDHHVRLGLPRLQWSRQPGELHRYVFRQHRL